MAIPPKIHPGFPQPHLVSGGWRNERRRADGHAPMPQDATAPEEINEPLPTARWLDNGYMWAVLVLPHPVESVWQGCKNGSVGLDIGLLVNTNRTIAEPVGQRRDFDSPCLQS